MKCYANRQCIIVCHSNVSSKVVSQPPLTWRMLLCLPWRPSQHRALFTLQMREMNHENLAAFIGLCIDPGNVCILTKYCTRGNLQVTNNSIVIFFDTVSRAFLDYIWIHSYKAAFTSLDPTRPAATFLKMFRISMKDKRWRNFSRRQSWQW